MHIPVPIYCKFPHFHLEESFVDAVSIPVSDNEVSIHGELADESQMEDEEFFDNEDVLEIEIDDAPASIGDFNQSQSEDHDQKMSASDLNTLSKEKDLSNLSKAIQKSEQPQQLEIHIGPQISTPLETSYPVIDEKPKVSAENQNTGSTQANPPQGGGGGGSQISPTEFEHLLTTLTTTFTEMGQFATDIKAQIATEIQQQLAAAVHGNVSNVETVIAGSL